MLAGGVVFGVSAHEHLLVVFHENGDGAVVKLYGGVAYKGLKAGCRSAQFVVGGVDAVVEEVIDIGGNVQRSEIGAAKALKIVFRLGVFPVEFQKRNGFLAVQGLHIVPVLVLDDLNGLLDGSQGVYAGGHTIGEQTEGACSKADKLNAQRSLREKGDGAVVGGIVLYVIGNVLDGSAVFFLAGRIGLNPGLEGGLFFLFTADYVEVLEREFLSLPLLPAIGAAGVFVGVLELDRRVCAHGLPHDVLAHCTGVYADAVGLNHVVKLGCGLVALGTAGITHDHGVVPFLDALQGYLKALGGLHGNIFLTVFGGHVVLAGIYAEHGEVAGVAGPHPVVGFSAEFTH